MSVQEYLVSSSGQMSLPASARHRWHLDDGGPVEVIDLGFGVLTVPKGAGHRLLDDLVSREDHDAFVRSLADDPDSRDDVTRAILDDHLLRDLLAHDIPRELEVILAEHEPATTNHYLYRLCRSVVSAAGGALTGTWDAARRRALGSQLVHLPADVEIIPMQALAYRMAELSGDYSISTLGAEAIAAAVDDAPRSCGSPYRREVLPAKSSRCCRLLSPEVPFVDKADAALPRH